MRQFSVLITLTVNRTKYFWLFSPTQLFTLKNRKENSNEMKLIEFRRSDETGIVPRTVMIHFTYATLTYWTVVSTFWFYTAAFWTFEKDLAFLEAKLLDNFFCSVSFWHSALHHFDGNEMKVIFRNKDDLRGEKVFHSPDPRTWFVSGMHTPIRPANWIWAYWLYCKLDTGSAK